MLAKVLHDTALHPPDCTHRPCRHASTHPGALPMPRALHAPCTHCPAPVARAVVHDGPSCTHRRAPTLVHSPCHPPCTHPAPTVLHPLYHLAIVHPPWSPAIHPPSQPYPPCATCRAPIMHPPCPATTLSGAEMGEAAQ